METSRRSFLKGLFAVTFVTTSGLPAMTPALPRIVGDGVHDDWAGLQACFDGKPFVVENESVVAADARLTGGIFRMTRSLVLSGDNFHIHNASFIADHTDGPALRLSGRGGYVSNVHIRGGVDTAILVDAS